MNNNLLQHKKNKFNLKQKKENTICSLYEVENFLSNLNIFLKSVKLYKLFKK